MEEGALTFRLKDFPKNNGYTLSVDKENFKTSVFIKIDTLFATTKTEDDYPSWSQDGTKITFQSNRHGGKQEIYIMDSGGKNIQQLTHLNRQSETPVFSPDGKSILFASYLDDKNVNNEVFLMNVDGSNLRRLTNHPARDGHAKFSPDGKKIIFCSQRDDEGQLALKNYELYEMNIDGSNIHRLTHYFEWDTYPSWSPDGSKILWRRILADTSAPRGYNSEIFVMDADGSNIKNLSNHQDFDGYPEWSPDGKYIAFVSCRDGETIFQEQLFVMEADGSNVRQISFNKKGEEDNRPDWSPDGNKLLFNRVNQDGSRVYVANVSETTKSVKSKEGKPYHLHYNSVDKQQAEQIKHWLTLGQKDLEGFFNKGFKKGFDVYIFSARDSLDKQWQKDWNMPNFKSQCWMVASGIAHRLDILSPRIWKSQACEHDNKDTIATNKLIIHELVHVFHGQNNPSPTFENIENIDWFVEGIAVYVSRQLSDGRYKRMKKYILEEGGPSKLADIWKGEHKYGLAGSIVKFIDKKYGRDILIKLISFTKATEILTILNISEEELIREWKQSLN